MLPDLETAIKIIEAARSRGDQYAGRYSEFAAKEIGRVLSLEYSPELYSLANTALGELDKGKSLMDSVTLNGKPATFASRGRR